MRGALRCGGRLGVSGGGSGGRLNSKRGWDWSFNYYQTCPLLENHTAERNGTTAQWDRLTKRAIHQRTRNSERAANSESWPDGGDAQGLTDRPNTLKGPKAFASSRRSFLRITRTPARTVRDHSLGTWLPHTYMPVPLGQQMAARDCAVSCRADSTRSPKGGLD